jgi:indolepyruvate ferredoxin oxidoreductase beta subunit
MNKEINIVLAGVGGQGTLVAGKLLGTVAVAMGFDVKVSEVHGMSQRGGSVITYVRMGEKVYSPVIENGMADFVLAFEELEALRWAPLLKDGGTMIINRKRILPVTVKLGKGIYPDGIVRELANAVTKGTAVIEIDAEQIAVESGNVRCVNTVMIGAMSQYSTIPEDIWKKSITEVFAGKLQEMNRIAFEKGRDSKVSDREVKL